MFFKITPQKIANWKNKGNIAKLIKAVNDKDEQISNLAVDALNRLGGTEAVEDMISALGSNNRKTQLAAIKGLGKLGDKRACSALLSMLSFPQEIKYEAVVALGKIKDSSTAQALLNAADDMNDDIHNACIESLFNMGEAISPILINHLSIEQPLKTRICAAKVLGKLTSRQAINALVKCLHDKNKDLVNAAEKALINIGKPATEAILPLLENKETAPKACRIIAEIGDLHSVQYLVKILEGNNKEAIAEALAALSRLGDNKIADKVLSILTNEAYEDVKIPKDTDISEEEKEQYTETNAIHRDIRRNAIKALGVFKSTAATDAIIKALKNTYTRDEAVTAIIRIGETAVRKALEKDEWFAGDAESFLRKNSGPENKQILKIIEERKK